MLTQSKLRRQKGMIAGVCGGLGAFFGLNPWIFRILFLILIPAAGSPIIPYLLLWLLIPEKRY
jgi:phage shock protein C